MMKRAFICAGLAACAASPAFALTHEVVIDHAAGPIAADYRGAVTIETKQVGTAGGAGRPSSLNCRWTASLNVERVAKVGEVLSSRRTLTKENVTSGLKPGWCPVNPAALDKLADTRNVRFQAALLALVAQDRAELLAEAESVTTTRG